MTRLSRNAALAVAVAFALTLPVASALAADAAAPPQTATMPVPAQPPAAQTSKVHTIYFEPGRAQLGDGQIIQLNAFIYNNIQRSGTSPIRVVGYADPTGGARANHQLSRRRAEAVANYLEYRGIPRDRLVVEGAGAAPAKARRVDLIAGR